MSLEEYINSDGIVAGAKLHDSILKGIEDVDKDKDILIDIVKYEARKDFIGMLTEIRINLDEETTCESFSCKLLSMAVDVLKQDVDIHGFRKKLVIEKGGGKFSHDQIPQTVAESFEVEGAKRKFDLAQVLPNESGNGSLLIEMAEKYSKLGVQRAKLNKLFGISETVDIDSLYEKLIANYKTLQNGQQLAFVLTVCRNRNKVLPEFYLRAVDNNKYKGDTGFLVKDYDFIKGCYALSNQYENIEDFIDLPYENDMYISSPYINNKNEFICPGVDTKKDGHDDFKKVIALLEYLNSLYKRDNERFKSVDWANIKDSLSFTPTISVYPLDYAWVEEKLPFEVETWAKESSEHEKLIDALGVLTGDCVVMKFSNGQKITSTSLELGDGGLKAQWTP